MDVLIQPRRAGVDRNPALASLLEGLGTLAIAIEPVGSRITCSPPPADTDEDWLLLVRSDPSTRFAALGFGQDGSPEFYTGNDEGGFRSWRQGDLNVVTTQDPEFFERFLLATHLAKRFNLLVKADRIALFQAVLYGVRLEHLEEAPVRVEEFV